MTTKSIKVEVSDPAWLMQLGETREGDSVISLQDARLLLPPHVGASSNLTAGEVLVLVADFAGNVGAGVIAAFLYNALAAGRIKRVAIDGRSLSSQDQIEAAVLKPDDQDDVGT